MNFFQRIGNALSRFMYGRNGVDRLCLTMIWAALLLDIINIFLRDRQPAAYTPRHVPQRCGIRAHDGQC